MHEGRGREGQYLYPAFPYPWFTQIDRAGSDAMLAWLKTVPPVNYRPPSNDLPFPLNLRLAVLGWNLLNFKPHDFEPDHSQTSQWNRGAELVNGPGHCGACHTPKNALGGDRTDRRFFGGALEATYAPDLTGNSRTGLGRWTVDDITEYLRSGRNARSAAGSSMAEVITYSTSVMSDDDLLAIATYLKSLPPRPDAVVQHEPNPAAMARGAAIFTDACSGCHLEDGVGQPRFFPTLRGNAMLQQSDPAGLIHLILAGTRVGPSPSRPSPLSMPSFAWKLSDSEIAVVSTYLRNSWGNAAPDVDPRDVNRLRKSLELDQLRPTANSGDWK